MAADIDAFGEDGKTSLLRAVAGGDLPAVDSLLAQGADPTLVDRNSQECALLLAARARDAALTRRLMDAGREWRRGRPLRRLDDDEFVGLGAASVTRFVEFMRSGVDPDSTVERHPRIKLMSLALHTRDDRTVCLLLQCGADVGAIVDVHQFQLTVLHGAADGCMTDVVWMLLRDGADATRIEQKRSVLYSAISGGSAEIVEMLLEAGADIESGLARETPLMLAAGHGSLAIVELLLSRGANVHAQSSDGLTALHEAADARALPVVRRLLDAGADPLARDGTGRTATDHLVFRSDPVFAQPMRDWGIPDAYSLESVEDAWDANGEFDFFISYRHGRFAAQARELAAGLQAAGCRPFLDQEMLELPADELASNAVVKSRLAKALRRSRTVVFFESYIDAGQASSFNWQFFELLHARDSVLVRLDRGSVHSWIVIPGEHLQTTGVIFEFDDIGQLATRLVQRQRDQSR
ncbi:MAG TPA: ankyrin repeat domain-containing protein [Steroidobacteraceae bacterium]|nr:ankyrin repeat domain-containing protein [Steroidobacteraceae bacterium]